MQSQTVLKLVRVTKTRQVHPRKRRKVDNGELSTPLSDKTSTSVPLLLSKHHIQNEGIDLETTEVKNGESITMLRRMVFGRAEYKDGPESSPGKYLALDCEMVGVGIDGNESSLARVSVVNYTGAIILDVFVQQRERVVDYRTEWSGIRSTDLASSAKPFHEVQQTVAELIKDRILVGHAIHNDLKALLLSHPSSQTRDTQSLAYKHRVAKSRRPALRVLIKQELNIMIQEGEHSSVMDARATMALFRLYKKQWESGFRLTPTLAQTKTKNTIGNAPRAKVAALGRLSSYSVTRGRKRSHSASSTDDATEPPSPSRVPSLASSTASRSLTQQTSSTPLKYEREKRGPRPAAGSAHRKETPSGIPTVIHRRTKGREVQRKGAQLWSNVRKGGAIENNKVKKWNQPHNVGEGWWKSLGGKRASTKL